MRRAVRREVEETIGSDKQTDLMATEPDPDYYIVTLDSGQDPFPWRWELTRHSRPMGVKIGTGGYQTQADAEHAGRNALMLFLHQLAQEERRDK